MKRTFIAVKVVQEEILENAVRNIKMDLINESVKWVDPDQYHITLAFLGDTSDLQVSKVMDMLSGKCSDFGNIEIAVKGIRVFRNLRNPRVIWAGISEGGKLEKLTETIREGLRETGISIEDRPFRPHLTLARIRSLGDPPSISAVTGKYESAFFQKTIVSEVIYFESILMQTGSIYVPLKKISL